MIERSYNLGLVFVMPSFRPFFLRVFAFRVFSLRIFLCALTTVCCLEAVCGEAPRSINDTAHQAFTQGDYAEVVSLADAAPTASSLALAARALNTQAYLAEKDKKARHYAKKARRYALRALAVDANHVEAHLQAAISDAVRGGKVGPVRAFLSNLAGRSRGYLDTAIALDPDNGWALSTSGAWHLEVARSGGGRVYGANRDEGYQQMVRAFSLMPGNVSIAYETALRLLASEREDWRHEALRALDVAAHTGQISASHEEAVRVWARALEQAVEKGPGAVEQFVRDNG